MEEVGKPSGMVKRKSSAVWYFRQRCPKHLKATGSPSEIWISLETASYPLALTRIDDARQEAQRRFTAPRAPNGIYSRSQLPDWQQDEDWPALTTEQAAPLARAFFSDAIRELDSQLQIPAEVDDASRPAWRVELEGMLARLVGPEPEDGIDDVAGARLATLRKAKLKAERGSEACNLLHNYLRRAMAQATKIELARLNDDFSDRITDRLFANCLAPGATQPPFVVPGMASSAPLAGVVERTLEVAADRYLAELLAKSTADKTKDRYRAELRHIVGFFGKETPVWQINAEECDRFRTCFSLLPPNFEDKIRSGMSIPDIIAARGATDRVLAWATLDKMPVAVVALPQMGAPPRLCGEELRRWTEAARVQARWLDGQAAVRG